MGQGPGSAKGVKTGLMVKRSNAGQDPGAVVEQLSQRRFPFRTTDDLFLGQRDDGQNFIHRQVP
jgi:hypothetical protein